MLGKRLLAALLAAVLALSVCGCAKVYTENVFVFSSDILLSLRLYGKKCDRAADEMRGLFDGLARSADTTDPNSTVSRFNAAAVGDAIELEPIADALIAAAENLYTETAGAFNVALLPLSRLWNVDAENIHKYTPNAIDGTYVSPESLPALDEVNRLLATANPSSWTRYELDGKAFIVKNAPVEIDLGGLAKGWATDRCAEIAAKYGLSGRIDCSGNLYLIGKYYNDTRGANEDWYIGLTDPRPRPSVMRGYVAAIYHTGDVGIVTSGDYERYYFYDGLAVPHIIGRDGLPVGLRIDGDGYAKKDGSVSSATVIGKSSMLADAYATAVCVMGLEEGMRFLSTTDYAAVILTDDYKRAVKDVRFALTDTYDGITAYEEVPWTA